MLRQQRLSHLEQFRSGEQVEEIHRCDRTGVVGDASGMLLGDKARITIPQRHLCRAALDSNLQIR